MSFEQKLPHLLTSVPKCKHAKARPSPNDFGTIITVKVGIDSKEQTFWVHRGLLCYYSSFFRAAIKPEWDTDDSRTIALPDDKPEVFKVFFSWLYSGSLYTNLTTSGRIPLGDLTICATWVFGDARGIPELCNAAVDLLFQKYAHEWSFPNRCLGYIYENTVANSKLRKFFVSLATETFSFSDARAREELYPKDFLISVIMHSRAKSICPGQMGRHRVKYLEKMESTLCSYHDHMDPHLHRNI